jgi:hypothetical protein
MLNYLHMSDWTYEAIRPRFWTWEQNEQRISLPVIQF